MANFFKNKVLPIFTNIQWLDISVSTYVRWILVILVTINTILTMIGWNPIPYSETVIYEAVSYIMNIAILIVNTYKNNSTSKEAIIADKIMRALKIAATSDKDTTIEKIEEILKELNGKDFIPINQDHTNNEISDSNGGVD